MCSNSPLHKVMRLPECFHCMSKMEVSYILILPQTTSFAKIFQLLSQKSRKVSIHQYFIHLFLVQCCDVRYDFRRKTMFGSSLPSVVCISVICVWLCILVSNTYCVVFLLCLSSSFVLCTQCCQFFWIVRSRLPLRFSLMFTYLLTLGYTHFVQRYTKHTSTDQNSPHIKLTTITTVGSSTFQPKNRRKR